MGHTAPHLDEPSPNLSPHPHSHAACKRMKTKAEESVQTISSLEMQVAMLKNEAAMAASKSQLEIQLATAQAESNMKTVALAAMERNYAFGQRSAAPLSGAGATSSPFFSM